MYNSSAPQKQWVPHIETLSYFVFYKKYTLGTLNYIAVKGFLDVDNVFSSS